MNSNLIHNFKNEIFSQRICVYDDIIILNTSYRRNFGGGGATGSKSPLPPKKNFNLRIAFWLLSSKGANKKIEVFL